MKGILVALMFLAAPAHAQIYKCVGADGKVNFTDAPCSSTDKAETIERVPPQGFDKMRIDLEASRARHAEYEKERALRKQAEGAKLFNRRIHKGLRLGMTDAEVKALPDWGWPDDTNVTRVPKGTHEQWVYQVDQDNEYEVMYLYFINGILITIQD